LIRHRVPHHCKFIDFITCNAATWKRIHTTIVLLYHTFVRLHNITSWNIFFPERNVSETHWTAHRRRCSTLIKGQSDRRFTDSSRGLYLFIYTFGVCWILVFISIRCISTFIFKQRDARMVYYLAGRRV
jgi:hypothetical protein